MMITLDVLLNLSEDDQRELLCSSNLNKQDLREIIYKCVKSCNNLESSYNTEIRKNTELKKELNNYLAFPLPIYE